MGGPIVTWSNKKGRAVDQVEAEMWRTVVVLPPLGKPCWFLALGEEKVATLSRPSPALPLMQNELASSLDSRPLRKSRQLASF